MAQLVGSDDIESLRIQLSDVGQRSLRRSSFRSNSNLSLDDECLLQQWAAIDRLPTFERLKSSLFDDDEEEGVNHKGGKRVIDVTKLTATERHMLIEKLIKHIGNDNLRLLHKLRKRIDKVSVKLPSVEVRYKNLRVEAECEIVHGKPLPTIWNAFQSMLSDIAKVPGFRSKQAKISIINDISGIIRPGRITLLLGPPDSGKTSLLKALSGNLNKSLKVTGEISYNGHKLQEFIPQKTSAYISQNDLHIPEMTVRETLDFSARCQGIGRRAEVMVEVSRREKEAGIVPDPDIDTYMKAISVGGQEMNLQTDYILKILGLDVCADTLFGDAMRRGISGGQKKRLTTGEMIVGPTNALFMDEISNGLDSSTTYQIITCLQQLAHISDATVLVSLLQPSPETFDLFDDIMLLAEGKIVYHGPRCEVLEFFEDCGFRCPERKGIADFLQEVLSRKDQAQYSYRTEKSHNYVSVDTFSRKFKESPIGKKLDENLLKPLPSDENENISFHIYSLSKWQLFRACLSREFLLMRRNSFIYVFKLVQVLSRKDQAQYSYRTEKSHNYVSVDTFSRKFKESPIGKKLDENLLKPLPSDENENISFHIYSLSKWQLFRACLSREFLLMRRNSFIYVFKLVQLFIIGTITMTVFLRTRMDIDVVHANYYLGALFYSLIIFLVDGFPELAMTLARLPVFYKQRDLYFYPAWAYTIPTTVLKIPISLLVALVWTSLTYYVIGYAPEPGRFFRQLVLLFAMHLMSLSMFRLLASIFRTIVASTTAGSLSILFLLSFGGFIIPHPSMPVWLKWGFWVCPLSYGEIGLSVNEFLAQRWQKVLPTNTTIGQAILESRGLDYDGYYFWISLGALFGFTMVFNIGFTLALAFLNPPGSRVFISKEKLSQIQANEGSEGDNHVKKKSSSPCDQTSMERNKDRMVLPFQPLTVVFQDLQYSIDTPLEMREQGFSSKRLQLLYDITGAFRPGVLTALMGVSGAGKTTLLDVLSGRKTSGFVEGDIKIGGYTKVQDTFARISGYCEQNDVHSPQITVEESVIFSAWLRLHPQIDPKTKSDFVKEVLETIELDGVKDALVGIAGSTGLSTEQRKRLTIAVELVANPSIIFMDEPTTGLDARSAAIVMRAVKNVVDTGRTIVCTIHQPSIDIFEAFDELILLKTGGRMIYCGPLGQHSSSIIEYFEGISGVPKIRNNYNPATWMLEVTSTSTEAELGVDFSQIYMNSSLYQENNEHVRKLSTPPPGSENLHFSTRFPQSGWGQFKLCLWKQHWSYWRSPSYNLMRSLHMLLASLLFGGLFWNQGRKIHNQQSLFIIFGSMFSAVLFCGINNSSSAMPYVSTERDVVYRERFSGMYSSWAYALAQVVIEVPYVFAHTLAFVMVTYPMIGYQWTAYKVFWYFYSFFCTLMYFTYLGMLLVSLTPSLPVASILSSCFYAMFNLFSGFLIPRPQIPKWWLWLYYITPTSWTLNGMLTSQYGDVNEKITVFGETTTVAAFLRDYFGLHHSQLSIVALVLLLMPIAFAFLFAFCIANLNFQRR